MGEVEISNKDYELLKNGDLYMVNIMNKYDLNYDGDSEPIYEDTKFDSIEWED